jgi:hypothetical protein
MAGGVKIIGNIAHCISPGRGRRGCGDGEGFAEADDAGYRARLMIPYIE